MSFKWNINAPESNANPVEMGGEVRLEEFARINLRKPWLIDPSDTDVQLEKASGGTVKEFGTTNLPSGSTENFKTTPVIYSVRSDKSLVRFMAGSLTLAMFSIVWVAEISILAVIISDIYKGSLTTKDLIPLILAFLAGSGMKELIGMLFKKTESATEKDSVEKH